MPVEKKSLETYWMHHLHLFPSLKLFRTEKCFLRTRKIDILLIGDVYQILRESFFWVPARPFFSDIRRLLHLPVASWKIVMFYIHLVYFMFINLKYFFCYCVIFLLLNPYT